MQATAEPRLLVPAPGEYTAPVGGERHRQDLAGVSFEPRRLLPGVDVPEPRRAVPAPGEDAVAVGGERQGKDPVGVAQLHDQPRAVARVLRIAGSHEERGSDHGGEQPCSHRLAAFLRGRDILERSASRSVRVSPPTAPDSTGVPRTRYPSRVSPRAPLLLLLLAAACKSPPPPVPATAGASVVALALRTRPDREVRTGRPVQAYFVKLAEGTDAAKQPVLLRSNFTEGGVMYLLDAEPGRYAAVACYGRGEGREWTAYFPEDLILASAKDVPEGKAVLLGSFEMDLRPITTTGDEAQHHYFQLLWPNWNEKSPALKLFVRDNHAWGGPWLDEHDETEIVARMKRDLGAAWASRFE